MDIDSDNDGLRDEFERAIDTDGDGVMDFLDLDSDNDGLTDLVEAGGIDIDGDGRIDSFTDTDGDGWDDLTTQIPLLNPDTDNDLIKDYLDLDSDNDSVSDLIESGAMLTDADGDGRIDLFIDSNQNGRDDTVEALPIDAIDTDADGISDQLDLDSDNDGEFDITAAGAFDADNNGKSDLSVDIDQDGIPDSVDVDFTNGRDADIDGIDDRADADFNRLIDSDLDGIVDIVDADTNGDGQVTAADIQPVSLIDLGGTETDGAGLSQNGLGSNELNSAGEPAEAGVYTGLDGEGCSVSAARDGNRDPSLLLMCIIALGALRRRSTAV